MLAGEDLIGARAYRVIFALVSLPLAALALVYFINHRYSGMPLWNLRSVPGIHDVVWILNFISFYFLYPSTFNILEVSCHPCWISHALSSFVEPYCYQVSVKHASIWDLHSADQTSYAASLRMPLC